VTATMRVRKWWGWGYEEDGVDPAAYERLRASLLHVLGDAAPRRTQRAEATAVRIPPPLLYPGR